MKKLKVSLNGKEVATVELVDSMALQIVNLNQVFPRPLKEGDALQFVLLEVYPGSKYQDTVLSELIPVCVP